MQLDNVVNAPPYFLVFTITKIFSIMDFAHRLVF